MIEQASGQQEQKPIGVIDAISVGYRLLVHFWGIILIPILLDIFFWLGPQISPWGAIQQLITQAPPEFAQAFRETLGLSSGAPAQWPTGPNVMTALVQLPGAPTPLAGLLGTLPAPPGWTRVVWAPSSPWLLMGILALLLFAGAPITGFYLAVVARALYRLQDMPFSVWRRALWATAQLVLLLIMGIALFIGLVLGLSVLMTLGLLIHPALGMGLFGIATFLVSWLLVLAMVLFYFAPASLVLQRAHIFQALSRSAVVVMRNSWSSFGFIIIVFVISQGFALIWHRLLTTLAGTLISIVGNAALTSGLAIATMVFFHSRYTHLIKELQRLTSSSSSQE